MKKTRTRLVVERHNLTILRPVPEKCAVINSTKHVMLLPETRRFSKKVTVPLGLLIWLGVSVLVDLLVMQIFPVPEGLWRRSNTTEVIASIPTAAVAFNFCGQMVMLAIAACCVTRLTRRAPLRAGLILTGAVMTLSLVNTLLARNFHWSVAVGLALVPLVGYLGTKLGEPPS